jgi:hypothetical protein
MPALACDVQKDKTARSDAWRHAPAVATDAAINLLVPCHRQSTPMVQVFLAAAWGGLLVANASRVVEMRRSHLVLFPPPDALIKGFLVRGSGHRLGPCFVQTTSRVQRAAGCACVFE